MATDETLLELDTEQARAFIEAHLNEDPVSVALLARKQGLPPSVATQIKYLQRARNKLPRYYAARCLLPPRAFEQSSGERAAALLPYFGNRCLDLTLGLGVDSLHLSHQFETVVGTEANPTLAEITRRNLARLGTGNVLVFNVPADKFLQTNVRPPFDLIYLDPDRRDERGGRHVALDALRPHIIGLLPRLKKMAKRIVVKLSPLFDLTEGERVFGETLARQIVVGVDGEVKAVLVELDPNRKINEPPERAIWLDRAGVVWRSAHTDPLAVAPTSETANARYAYEPDPAFYKARVEDDFMVHLGRNEKIRIKRGSSGGYFFGDSLPKAPFPGRIFRIHEHLDFQPKILKKRFRKNSLLITRRNFPLSVAALRKKLQVSDGGERYLLASTVGGKAWLGLAERVT